MDLRTKIALEESILHWKLNEATLDPSDVLMGSAACALCEMFHRRHGCTGCPVQQRTGQTHCDGSPYARVLDAKDAWEWFGDDVVYGEGHEFIVLWRAREAFKAAARDEIRFLESLREEA